MDTKKTFLIAGATSGIGAALASRLIGMGHTIIAIGRTQNTAIHQQISFITYDFSGNAPLPEITENLDGLIYCLGTINLKPISLIREKDIQDDLSVNVLGAFRFVQRYVGLLKLSEDPSILMFSSVAVQTGMPYHTSVSISKGAIEGFTRSLAAELSPKIRVNCIAPSLTDTPLAKNLLNSDAKRQANADRHPLKKIGTPENVAALGVFLLNEATWMTGQVVGMNGGLGDVLK